jgi:hypothetical protein
VALDEHVLVFTLQYKIIIIFRLVTWNITVGNVVEVKGHHGHPGPVTLTPHHNSLLEKAEKDTFNNSVGDPDPDPLVRGTDRAPDLDPDHSFFS